MKKPTFKERFQYWFDNRMSKGSLSMIKFLALVTVFAVLFFSLIMNIFGFNGQYSKFETMWDILASIINAWIPSSTEGGIGGLIVKGLAGVTGLLVTSVLIGIVSSAIEEKIESLKCGNSTVLETGHFVILGFTPGEYTLIQQLILSASGEKRCILVAGEQNSSEMFQNISDGIDIPKNIKLICRSVDLSDPKTLEKCSLQAARSVIINPADDLRVVKRLFAASKIVDSSNTDTKLAAVVSNKRIEFPKSLTTKHSISAFNTHEIIAMIIARSCYQSGIADAILNLFDYEGSNFYLTHIPEAVGKSFSYLTLCLDKAVPVGVFREGDFDINPSPDTVINENDKILVFAEARNKYKIAKPFPETKLEEIPKGHEVCEKGEIVIFGSNDTLDTILYEMPGDNPHVTIVGFDSNFSGEVKWALEHRPNIKLTYSEIDDFDDDGLTKLVENAEHVILLANHNNEAEREDMKTILLLLALREIRELTDLDYTLTVELIRDSDMGLIDDYDNVEFIVTSKMAQLFLASLAESPELCVVFGELLLNSGNGFSIKEAKQCLCTGTKSVAQIRDILLQQKCIFLGYRKKGEGQSVFNPALYEQLNFNEEDKLIVITAPD